MKKWPSYGGGRLIGGLLERFHCTTPKNAATTPKNAATTLCNALQHRKGVVEALNGKKTTPLQRFYNASTTFLQHFQNTFTTRLQRFKSPKMTPLLQRLYTASTTLQKLKKTLLQRFLTSIRRPFFIP